MWRAARAMNYFSAQFLLLSAVFCYCNSSELAEKRADCKSKSIQIPSGKTIRSEVLSLDFGNTVDGRARKSIVHEQCKDFMVSISRSRRSLRRFVPWNVVKKYGKQAAKGSKKVWKNKGKSLVKGASAIWKYGKKIRKPVASMVKTGALKGFSSVVSGAAEGVVESFPRLVGVATSDSSGSEEEDTVEIVEKEPRLPIGEFRRNVGQLLKNHTLEGFMLKIAYQNLGENSKLFESLKASDVRCERDDFTGIYSVQFRVMIPQWQTVEARMCGGNAGGEYFEGPRGYVLDRDGSTYSVDGSQCVEQEDSLMACPERSLQVLADHT